MTLSFTVFFTSLWAQDLETVAEGGAVKVSGDLSGRFVFYNASGIESRRDPFGYVLGGNINVDMYGLSLPFSFTYSNQGSYFGQPFNQFGVSPTYKWATLHLGYRNISHSSYTLAGHQLLGAGFELNPGKLRMSFISGRLRKAVEHEQLSFQDTVGIDSLLLEEKPIIDDPVYRRNGWSAKIGYGDNNNFIDLILFKAADEAGSIGSDSVAQFVAPEENAVIGVNARKTLFNVVNFYFESALSSYTRDLDAAADSAASGPMAGVFRTLHNVNSSTSYHLAMKTGFIYSATGFSLRTGYERIDPDYRSMGAYYFHTDRESISLAPSFMLFKNRVSVSSSLAHHRDNLQNTRSFTTRRTIPQVNISINPSHVYGFDLGYQNTISRQSAGLQEVNDTLAMNMNNPGITAGARLNLIDTIASHNFLIMINRFELADRNAFTRPYSNYVASIVNFNYNLYLSRSALNFNLNMNVNRLENFAGDLRSFGLSAGGGKSLAKNKLHVNASVNSSFSETGNILNLSGGLNYNPSEAHAFSVNLAHTESGLENAAFTEFNGFFEYRYSF